MKSRVFVFICGVVVLGACGKSPPPAAGIQAVKTLAVAPVSATDVRAYSGEVRARHETLLAFRVGGKMMDRLVDVGAVVKAGQPLARLDPADLSLQASQAEAQRALAQADAGRYRDLRGKNFVSQSALDARETTLAAANAQAALARNQEGYAVLRADRTGVIAQVMAEPGQVVAPGQGVFRLAQAGEIEVAIAVPESQRAKLKVGMDAEIIPWAAGKPLRGRLRELAPMADAATRTYPVRVSLLDSRQDLLLGMTATVRFLRAGDEVIVVPLAALFQKGEKPAVWVVAADETLVPREVAVGAYTDAGATITAGLAAGERVVAAGAHMLNAGQKVRPLP